MGNDWFHEYFINELKAIGRKPTSNMQHEVVDSLPSSGNEQTIYFVKNDSSSSNNHYDEYVWISSSSTFEKIGSTQIDGSATQPDWNQNDATQPDYVKNRPFYTGDPAETVLVEESTASFVDTGNGLYGAQIQSTFEATAGETYKVSWDGTAYECTCVYIEGHPAIGNLSIPGFGSDSGEPFIIVSENVGAISIATTDTSSSHTISISLTVVPIIKINQKYLPLPFKPKGESYLTFSSPNKFTLETNDGTKHWDGALEYFTSDETWGTWDGTNILSAVANGGEYVLYLRGIENSIITGNSGGSWILNGTDIKCIGNIENLLDYATVESGSHPSMSDSCYFGMFYGCTSLIQSPELPATRLTTSCYKYMFSYCSSLTQAPELPATRLTISCYDYMFAHCSSLTQAPELPATALASSCYKKMFYGCINLTKLPILPATDLPSYCYQSMFYGCTSLKLSSTKTDEYIQEYRVPSSGNGTMTLTIDLNDMFASTGGTFAGTPSINTTYYLSSDNMIIRETEIATLNGYVGSMIDAALNTIGVAEEGAY